MQNAKLQNQSGARPYYYHLNGLKGTACLLIMLGHYVGIYQHARSFLPPLQLIDRLNQLTSSLFDEGYWLYLFFVVSGYLVAKSEIGTVKDLLVKAVTRFLRLAFPVFFSCLIIYLLSLTAGFHTAETVSLFQSAWFQNSYPDPIALKDVLLSPFTVLLLGDARLNAPYWVLRSMFLSSLLIYLLKYLYAELKGPEHETAAFSGFMLITALSYALDPIITACLVGMLVSLYENSGIWRKPCFALWMLVLARAVYVVPVTVRPVLFFVALVLLIPRVPFLNRIFSSKPFQFLGNISWGIYSFHWPVTCSAGALAMIALSGRIGLKAAYSASFLIVFLLTAVLSLCFSYSFERLSSFLTGKAGGLLKRLLK